MEEKDEQLLDEQFSEEEALHGEALPEETSPEEPLHEEYVPLGEVRITEDVIAHLATKALLGVEGVQAAAPGFSAKLGLGRKSSGGVRITVGEGTPPEIGVDTYVNIRYGLRIPDVAWDVQEIVKNQLEAFTGYRVKAVNVFVQGIFFGQAKAPEVEPEAEVSPREEPQPEEAQPEGPREDEAELISPDPE